MILKILAKLYDRRNLTGQQLFYSDGRRDVTFD
jgi:hypothetical protein